MPPKRPKRGIAAVKKKSAYVCITESEDEDLDGYFSATPPTPQTPAPSVPLNVEQSRSQNTLAQTLFGDLDDVKESIEHFTAENLSPFDNTGVAQSEEYHKDQAHQELPRTSRTRKSSFSTDPPLRDPASIASHTSSARPDQSHPSPQRPRRTFLISATPFEIPKRRASPSNIVHIPDTDQDDMAAFIPNSQQRHMRACMVCSIVRTHTQFVQQGCPNCEAFLELTGNPDQVAECTSQVFDGLLTVSDTSRSWVARHQRLEGYVPGVYAVQVEGILPEEVIVAAENAGVQYIPRDGSVSEALPTDG